MDRPDVFKLLVTGEANASKEYATRNKGREANLRAGNTGARGPSGICVGECPRVPVLRALGVDKDYSFSKSLMFGGGHGSEFQVVQKLRKSWTGSVMQEGVIHTEWKTERGRSVFGSPDILLTTTEGGGFRVIEGVEKKCISSGYSFITYVIKEEPRSSHVLQAAHYSWQLGVPFTLLYVSRVNFHVTRFQEKLLEGVPRHPSFKIGGRGGAEVVAFDPWAAAYQLSWRDNTLWYTTPSGKEVATVITPESIKAFFEYVDECLTDKVIPCKAVSKTVTGDDADSVCKYCPFKKACKESKKLEFDDWVEKCKQSLEEGESEDE